jgi:ribosomal protein S18 acetylase RimI-like enzyme
VASGAASAETRCTGFLRYLVQVIGAEEGRPAVMHNGKPLLEGYVDAFGVDPQRRRCGIGTELQTRSAAVYRVMVITGFRTVAVASRSAGARCAACS